MTKKTPREILLDEMFNLVSKAEDIAIFRSPEGMTREEYNAESEFNEDCAKALEATKLALRGAYHTNR